jgi:hypothetical protein
MRKKNTLGITLFEDQLLRSYLLSDNFRLLSVLSESFEVTLFTTSKIGKELKLRIPEPLLSVVTIKYVTQYNETFLQRITGFCLRQAEPGPTPKLKAQMARVKGEINVFGLALRVLVNSLFPNRVSVNLLRKFYLTLHKSNTNYTSSNNFDDIDLLFVTSLTNFSADVPIALSVKGKGKPVIGTVRSWDNLVTHGSLRFAPDIFLAHSNFMSDSAKFSQFLEASKIKKMTTPSYRLELLPKDKNSKELVIYACMGPLANPDEQNAIQWLIENWTKNFPSTNLLILEHPAFPLASIPSNLSQNISLTTIRYLDTTLTQYYGLLASAKLVIAGGTTVLLDAAFMEIPIAAVAFDFKPQNPILSALRSFDIRPHTKNFFEKCKVPLLSTPKDLIGIVSKSLRSPISISKLENSEIFIGDTDLNFCDALKETFVLFMDLKDEGYLEENDVK